MNSSNQLAPIILFVYNRPSHTRHTVEALLKNPEAKDSLLYIFADGPKEDASDDIKQKISALRAYIHTISGFKDVIIEESNKNKGLANSIISGVTKVIGIYGKVIVVEDDLVTHKYFLRYMNDALSFYEKDNRIFSIGAITEDIEIPEKYKEDVLVVPRVESCGWGTWIDRWSTVQWDMSKYSIWGENNKKQIKDFCKGGEDLWPMLKMQAEGKIDSWAIRWQYNLSIQNKLCLKPVRSLLTNIGMDGSGRHCGDGGVLPTTPLYDREDYYFRFVQNIKEDKVILRNYRQYYTMKRGNRICEVFRLIRSKLSIRSRIKRLLFIRG